MHPVLIVYLVGAFITANFGYWDLARDSESGKFGDHPGDATILFFVTLVWPLTWCVFLWDKLEFTAARFVLETLLRRLGRAIKFTLMLPFMLVHGPYRLAQKIKERKTEDAYPELSEDELTKDYQPF